MKRFNLKTLLIAGVSAVLAATLAIGGTLAYLTLTEPALNNVFTVGDIDIELTEKTGVLGEGGTVKSDDTGATYTNVMPGDYLQKEVTVANTGKNPAYVAVTVTLNNADKINAAIDDVYGDGAEGGQAMYDFIFDGWGINQDPRPGAAGISDARGVIDGTYGLPENVLKVDFTKTIGDYWLYGATNWFRGVDEKANQYWVDSVSVDNFGGGYYAKDMAQYEICYTYYIYLESGEASTLFKGLNVPAEFTNDQMKMFDNLNIDVEAAAIQADNMAIAAEYKNDSDGKAKTAFSVLAGEIEAKDLNYSNKPSGTVTPAYASMVRHSTWNSIWGEAYTNAKNSLEIKVYSGDTYLGTNSLNDLSKSANVTWHCYFNGEDFEEWTMTWAQKPTIDLLPTTVELWVDGEKVDETAVRMDSPDNLATITGAVINAKGEIVKFVTKNWTVELADGETYVAFVSTADALVATLEKGGDVVLTENIKIDPANMSNAYGKTGINVKNGQTIDGAGNTLDIVGADDTWDSGINTTGGVIKNITVTGSFRGIFINHTSAHSEPVILENVIIDGTVYTISCDQGTNQGLTATNSTFNGWTSYAKTLGEATFVDCSFGEGSGYAFMRPYAPTTFVGCDFEAGFTMDPRAAVTFENCTIGGVALTADNLATLVTSNIANATVK